MLLPSVRGGRGLLLAGFGGLLVLMLVVGADALLVLRQVRSSDAQVDACSACAWHTAATSGRA